MRGFGATTHVEQKPWSEPWLAASRTLGRVSRRHRQVGGLGQEVVRKAVPTWAYWAGGAAVAGFVGWLLLR